ncbi:MAG: hypothetical protein J6I55_04100 [Ruminococcus sp.]|nr:hypothetical protein [Ruminococcus sp.]
MDKFSYIKSSGTADDINKTISEFITDGNMILMYTNRFICCQQQEISDVEHLLEARVFNDTSEIKIMRGTIVDNFYFRLIDDSKPDSEQNSKPDSEQNSKPDSEQYIDEVHYLDIDLDNKNTSGNNYVTTGGGYYSLPVADAERIKIRNYISFDEQNIAQISDFRVVKFLRKGEQ